MHPGLSRDPIRSPHVLGLCLGASLSDQLVDEGTPWRHLAKHSQQPLRLLASADRAKSTLWIDRDNQTVACSKMKLPPKLGRQDEPSATAKADDIMFAFVVHG